MSPRRTPEEVVRAFCGAWERGELERFGDYLAEDAVFHMLPLEPARGIAAIRAECRKFEELGRRLRARRRRARRVRRRARRPLRAPAPLRAADAERAGRVPGRARVAAGRVAAVRDLAALGPRDRHRECDARERLDLVSFGEARDSRIPETIEALSGTPATGAAIAAPATAPKGATGRGTAPGDCVPALYEFTREGGRITGIRRLEP